MLIPHIIFMMDRSLQDGIFFSLEQRNRIRMFVISNHDPSSSTSFILVNTLAGGIFIQDIELDGEMVASGELVASGVL